MTKFDQRATAEADHHNPAGAFAEQQKSHHFTGVGADQGVRLIEPHLSLDGAVNRKAQRSGFLILHQKGLVVTLINQVLVQDRDLRLGQGAKIQPSVLLRRIRLQYGELFISVAHWIPRYTGASTLIGARHRSDIERPFLVASTEDGSWRTFPRSMACCVRRIEVGAWHGSEREVSVLTDVPKDVSRREAASRHAWIAPLLDRTPKPMASKRDLNCQCGAP